MFRFNTEIKLINTSGDFEIEGTLGATIVEGYPIMVHAKNGKWTTTTKVIEINGNVVKTLSGEYKILVKGKDYEVPNK
jgi:hypothetical protein